MGHQDVKFYQTGTFTVGNRLLPPEQRSVQSEIERTNSLNSGHRACQGCGEALGARYAIDAAMRATNNQMIAANATGCLEVFSTPYPESSWQIAWLHSLFGNAPAVATCLLYTSDAADDLLCVDLGGRRIIKKKKKSREQRHKEEKCARRGTGRRWRYDRHRLRLPLRHVRAK